MVLQLALQGNWEVYLTHPPVHDGQGFLLVQ